MHMHFKKFMQVDSHKIANYCKSFKKYILCLQHHFTFFAAADYLCDALAYLGPAAAYLGTAVSDTISALKCLGA